MSKFGGRHIGSQKPLIAEVIPNCPKCGKAGQVVSLRSDGTVSMFCIDCRTGWESLTEECPVCGESNGYAVKGLCAKCYGKKRGAA